MCHFLSQGSLLLLVQLVQALKAGRVLGDEGSLLQEREDVVGQTLGAVEISDIGEEGLSRDSLQGVADLAFEVVGQSSKLFASRVVVDVDPMRRSVLVNRNRGEQDT
jgi:hypothetical protein